MFNLLHRRRHDPTDLAVARGLGVASIAIGLTELLAPRQLEKAMGLGNGQTTGVFRALGVREVLHGIDILTHDDPGPGVRARVAGDLLDGALMAAAATRTKNPKGFATVATMVLGVVALDLIFAKRLSE